MLNTVYGALLADRRLQCRYRPLDAEEDKNYLVNPLGLVVRDAVTYLVCTLWDYDHPIQLALQRIGVAEALDTHARRPPSFVDPPGSLLHALQRLAHRVGGPVRCRLPPPRDQAQRGSGAGGPARWAGAGQGHGAGYRGVEVVVAGVRGGRGSPLARVTCCQSKLTMLLNMR